MMEFTTQTGGDMQTSEPLTGREATIATLRHKLAIAEARSEWGTKAQRQRETEAAATYRAKLAALEAK
jgi:hypothetical protein